MERSGWMSMSRLPRAADGPAARPAEGVGPVLIRGPVTDAVVAAIRSVHPDAQVIDRDAYLRVLVPGRCRLSRSAVETRLGQSFHLPADLEEVMPSFKGRLFISEEEAVWQGRGET